MNTHGTFCAHSLTHANTTDILCAVQGQNVDTLRMDAIHRLLRGEKDSWVSRRGAMRSIVACSSQYSRARWQCLCWEGGHKARYGHLCKAPTYMRVPCLIASIALGVASSPLTCFCASAGADAIFKTNRCQGLKQEQTSECRPDFGRADARTGVHRAIRMFVGLRLIWCLTCSLCLHYCRAPRTRCGQAARCALSHPRTTPSWSTSVAAPPLIFFPKLQTRRKRRRSAPDQSAADR